MKQLPDENELRELLEMARRFEAQMQEQCNIAKAIYEKAEKQIRDSKEAQKEGV